MKAYKYKIPRIKLPDYTKQIRNEIKKVYRIPKKKNMNFPQATRKYKLKAFNDTDKDGVMNILDCKPYNIKKQDWDIARAKKLGHKIKYMHPDEYLIRTGFDKVGLPEDYYNRYFEKYYDTEKEEMRPTAELSEIIKDPKKKVSVPFVFQESNQHEGRHRAYAAKEAGYESIPVIVPSLEDYPISERERIGEIFVKKSGLDRDPAYASEWIERFRKGSPESYMDMASRERYSEIIAEELEEE